MSLWGLTDYDTGNNKPKWANTSDVYGVTRAEAQVLAKGGVTPGWVKVTRGTGYIASISINAVGANYNTGGYLTITSDTGSGANISFGVNSATKQVNSVIIVSNGSGFVTTPTVGANATNSSVATFDIVMGGQRYNRNTYEVLVTTAGDVSGDASDDSIFPDS